MRPGVTRRSCCAAAYRLPELDPLAECLEANGVGWYVTTDGRRGPEADATVTAAGYRPVVAVEIPGDYQPEGVATADGDPRAPRSTSTSTWSTPASSHDAERRQRRPVSRRQGELDQPVHQRRVVDARWPPTSAGTSRSG